MREQSLLFTINKRIFYPWRSVAASPKRQRGEFNKGAGRDHWSYCYSVVLAGAGILGGQVYGSSDRRAAYPATNPVSPQDIAASLYHSLGIDPHTHLIDQHDRPLTLTTGDPVAGLYG